MDSQTIKVSEFECDKAINETDIDLVDFASIVQVRFGCRYEIKKIGSMWKIVMIRPDGKRDFIHILRNREDAGCNVRDAKHALAKVFITDMGLDI